MVACVDPFDPNPFEAAVLTWERAPAHIYLDNGGYRCSIIDGADYQWATQWRWCAKKDRTGSVYARRAVGVNHAGMRVLTYSVYLHVELMKRLARLCGIYPPSARHFLVDHRNGNTSDNRRSNLRWATVPMNRRNRQGRYPTDFFEHDGSAL